MVLLRSSQPPRGAFLRVPSLLHFVSLLFLLFGFATRITHGYKRQQEFYRQNPYFVRSKFHSCLHHHDRHNDKSPLYRSSFCYSPHRRIQELVAYSYRGGGGFGRRKPSTSAESSDNTQPDAPADAGDDTTGTTATSNGVLPEEAQEQAIKGPGFVERLALIARSKSIERITLWLLVPIFSSFLSYETFPRLIQALYNTILGQDTTTTADTVIITQVLLNGPVITSMAVLFALLVSMTISKLHTCQLQIQACFIKEIQAIRELERLIESTSASYILDSTELAMVRACIQLHADQLLLHEVNSNKKKKNSEFDHLFDDDPHRYIESDLLILQDCINDAWNNYNHNRRRPFRPPLPPGATEHLLTQLQTLTHRLLNERTNRWLAMKALKFPLGHYVTISLLAVSICITFLLVAAMDQADPFILLDLGLPVRILWTLLVTSFSTFAVLCYDLSRPLGSAYRVVGK